MESHSRLKEIVERLRRGLPAQAPLKDFIATNTLYSFQKVPFYEGLKEAHRKLGVKIYLDLEEYQALFHRGVIKKPVLQWLISRQSSEELRQEVLEEVLDKLSRAPNSPCFPGETVPVRTRLRDLWKKKYELDLITHVHPVLFRHLSHFVDQGISISPMPFSTLGFWRSLQELEQRSFVSLFKEGKKSVPSKLLFEEPWRALNEALKCLLGAEDLFEEYLFEMVQEHPGWSGLISVVEENPKHLNFERKIALHEALAFELLLELDYIEHTQKKKNRIWKPLSRPTDLNPPVLKDESHLFEVVHKAWEWSYYQELLTGLKVNRDRPHKVGKDIQVFFCIDDRCCSIRRHLEEVCPEIETFGTPGFFGVEFWYQSERDRFPVKLCPAPLKPEFLVKGTEGKGGKRSTNSDFLLSKLTHTLFGGWFVSHTLGLLSAFRLILNIFSPTLSPKVEASFRHTDDRIRLDIFRESGSESSDLKLGFDRTEMAERVFGLLRSCGLVKDFAGVIVMMGHGSSTVNNPHYAAYDCGACSGRPGSINARIFCTMANDPEVRELVKAKGIEIPPETLFVPALFDTTRDQVYFYDLSKAKRVHRNKIENLKHFCEGALLKNAKERSRRFEDIPLSTPLIKVRRKLRRKSVSIFEPRQEFTHSGNAACIIGPRSMTRGLFLDRRAFLNSYDPQIDPHGEILCNILKAAVPVCGGINLQYFFSRIDNEKMGSGTKLPHNVVGLVSVANGTEGDLRPGLPQQMVEWHEPLRLLIVVSQEATLALQAAKKNPATFEWIQNEWVKYVSMSPRTGECFVFEAGEMVPFDFWGPPPQKIKSSLDIVSTSRDYLPVTLIGEEA